MGWNLADIKSDALRRQLRTGLETRLARSCPVIQKREAPDTRETDYRSSKAEDHGHDHRRVPRTVRLTFHIADRRRRDIDGMTSTILDCMVKAGAIPDDNRFEVGRLEAVAVDCEHGQERVEVEIIGQ